MFVVRLQFCERLRLQNWEEETSRGGSKALKRTYESQRLGSDETPYIICFLPKKSILVFFGVVGAAQPNQSQTYKCTGADNCRLVFLQLSPQI